MHPSDNNSFHLEDAGGCNRRMARESHPPQAFEGSKYSPQGLGLQTSASYKEKREAPRMGSAYQVE
jgi:hypothetical protein